MDQRCMEIFSGNGVITDLRIVEAMFPELSSRIARAKQAVIEGHPFSVTAYYLREVIGSPAQVDDPLLSVILPDETDVAVQCDLGHLASNSVLRFTDSVAIAQKYQGSVIMMATPYCPQHCTHCFRKFVNDGARLISQRDIDQVFVDLDSARGDLIFDLILSGGEPLSISPVLLEGIALAKDKLNVSRAKRQVASLQVSINTRQPVVLPSSITGNRALQVALSHLRPMVCSIQILHPREITSGFCDVVKMLRESCTGLRTNHPLLKSVNDDPQVLVKLYTQLADLGVFPKDLIHPIRSGVPQYKCVTLERSMEIMRELVRALPGTLLPRLQCCTPNLGKSFIDPFHQKRDGSFGYDEADGEMSGLRTKDGTYNQPSGAF